MLLDDSLEDNTQYILLRIKHLPTKVPVAPIPSYDNPMCLQALLYVLWLRTAVLYEKASQ